MNAPEVAIIDSGGANINSIVFALERLGCTPVFTQDWDQIQNASHVVLPGVGAAAAAMTHLTALGLAEKIPRLTQPVLGICLGMQLLFERSEEGDVAGLGVIPDTVGKMSHAPGITIPHMGWNQNQFAQVPVDSMFNGIPDNGFAYFVHSFSAPLGPWTIAKCRHGAWFSSMVCVRNFVGIQFHPERSGALGSELLKNFLQWECVSRV
ncbi:MAG: imidazole glycerol phosphate synthase subunit HisH [Pirellulaceae bacterium]|nr:imidazole glycerol phosphate synthase subunit HisH [Pirellulaceae bacterium]